MELSISGFLDAICYALNTLTAAMMGNNPAATGFDVCSFAADASSALSDMAGFAGWSDGAGAFGGVSDILGMRSGGETSGPGNPRATCQALMEENGSGGASAVGGASSGGESGGESGGPSI